MEKNMKLIALNLTKIHAEKNKDPQGKIKVNPGNIKFNSVEKQEIPFSKDPCLKLDFEFQIQYEEYANISIAGYLIILLDKDTLNKCLKQWEKQTLPDDIRLAVINLILQKCSLRALQLEEELLLPLHVKMPHVLEQEPEKK